MNKFNKRSKLADFWLVPFFAGVFFAMGYIFTARTVDIKRAAYQEKINESNSEAITLPSSTKHQSTPRPGLINSKAKAVSDLKIEKTTLKEEGENAEAIVLNQTKVKESKNNNQASRVKRYEKTPFLESSAQAEKMETISSSLNPSESSNIDDIFDYLFQALPEPK